MLLMVINLRNFLDCSHCIIVYAFATKYTDGKYFIKITQGTPVVLINVANWTIVDQYL
jgi:hypothetical protein